MLVAVSLYALPNCLPPYGCPLSMGHFLRPESIPPLFFAFVVNWSEPKYTLLGLAKMLRLCLVKGSA